MVIYDLICNANHRFEGWFKSSDDFGHQSDQGLIMCPFCSTVEVRKLPSASYVSTRSSKRDEEARRQQPQNNPRGEIMDRHMPTTHSSIANQPASNAGISSGVNSKLIGEIRQFIESNSEDVGARFAEEAKRMHYGESEERNIRGQATREELTELKEDGIQVTPLPAFLTNDKNKLN